MSCADHLTSPFSTLFNLYPIRFLVRSSSSPYRRLFDRQSRCLQLQIGIMYSSYPSDSYPQKPGSSGPPPPQPPADGIPVQPMNQSYANYGAPNNPLPPAGLHARPINNVPWSSELFSCFDDVPTCKSSGIFLEIHLVQRWINNQIEQLCPCTVHRLELSYCNCLISRVTTFYKNLAME